tara:strand:- start:595 stop:1476 length:882 start_codon:yes stop_codon:yes gene_type:complete
MTGISRIIHTVVSSLNIETAFISLSERWSWFNKFIPLSRQYSAGTIKKVFRNEVDFELDISDYMQWHIWAALKDNSWKLMLEKSKNDQKIVFDIGANVGAFCLKVGRAFSVEKSDSKVFAFEPNPEVYNNLKRNYDRNLNLKNNVILEQIGLSNKPDTLKFSWDKSNSGGGTFVPRENTIAENLIEVPVVSLDYYVELNKIERIDFIKLDVEGYEPIVLEGARKVLENFKPELYVEVSPKWWENAGYSVSEVLGWIEQLQYKFVVYSFGKPKIISLKELSSIESQFDVHIIPS